MSHIQAATEQRKEVCSIQAAIQTLYKIIGAVSWQSDSMLS